MVHSHVDPTDPVPVLGDHLLLSHHGRHGIEPSVRVVGEGSGSPLLKQNCGTWAAPWPPTLPTVAP
ncbi:hypothetical protein ACH4CC_20590 [Streptomyces lydicus]|uniref:hypothetical protein n=1 Tax=Streptomyces lydicus TaxID=47763 RepID=UPI00378B6A2E